MKASPSVSSSTSIVSRRGVTLGTKRKQWIRCLDSKDPNSITTQLSSLLWDLRVWSTLNFARTLTERDENGKPKGWAEMHGLINRGFLTVQMIAIRRLCDGAYELNHPRKGVWSLIALLNDMEQHAGLLTRKALCKAHGRRFDLKQLHGEAGSEMRKELTECGETRFGSRGARLMELSISRAWHRGIDILTGVSCRNRSAEDSVRPILFRRLRRRLDKACKDIRWKATKYLAHNATPKSRRGRRPSLAETPAALFEAARVASEAYYFLGRVLGAGSPLTVAAELVDCLEHIECPLISVSDIPKVREHWHKENERLSTSFSDLRSFVKQLGVKLPSEPPQPTQGFDLFRLKTGDEKDAS